MLNRIQCPECGTTLEVDERREVVFCKNCGAKLMKIHNETQVPVNTSMSRTMPPVQNSGAPNLFIAYSSLRPAYQLTVMIGVQRWFLFHGNSIQLSLPAGKHTLIFRIANRGWKRIIYIPFDNTPVRINVLYENRTKIYIDQPPQGKFDWATMQTYPR